MLRETVRALAEAKIAPFAAEVDEEARFPQEALDALVAQRPARRARARGVRRRGRRRAGHGDRHRGGGPRLRVLLADPGRQQARLAAGDPVRLRGAEEEVPGAAGQGRRRCSPTACPSRTRARDAAGMKTRAVRDGDAWVLNGVKRWITNAGVSEFYTVMAVTDPEQALQGHLRLRRGEGRRGRLLRRPGEEARHQGLPDPRGLPRQRPHPRRPHDRRARAPASPPR